MKVLVGPNSVGLENALTELREAHPEITFVHCSDRDTLAGALEDADIYLGWLNRELFLSAKRLKWIQSPSSGVNHYLAIPELLEGGVLLTSASGTHGACLAESVLGMILSFTRGIRDSILRQPQHEWAGREIRPKMAELTGSTMGIVGFGAVGRSLARRAQVFGMRIIALDLYPIAKPDHVSELWGPDHLDDLLRESDYVVITVPYTSQTRGMIGAKQLALMKPSAMLVGISRGGIIDQVTLARMLRDGRLAAAALDVCDPEPLPADNELWELDNLLMTPHIAGGTQFEGQYILDIFRENLKRFLYGDLPLRNQVEKQRGF